MRVVPVVVDVIVAVYAISVVFLVVLLSRTLWCERGVPLPEQLDLSRTGAETERQDEPSSRHTREALVLSTAELAS